LNFDLGPSVPPPAPQTESALGPYLRAIRTYWVLVLAIMVAALAASAAMLSVRSPKYEARSRLLVTPLPQDDRTFLGLPVLRDSGDPTRTVQTAATLVKSSEAASLAADRIGQGWTSGRVLDAIDVQPEGGTNILDITASAGNSGGAARLANEYANAVLDSRRQILRREISQAINRLQARGVKSPDDASRLSELQSSQDGADPTLSLSQPALPPGSPSGAPSWLIVALALIAGFTLGSGAAIMRGMLDSRIHSEDELVRLYPLPVLARVPPEPGLLRRPRPPADLAMPRAVRGAFRSLAAQLDEGRSPRTIMVTSASSGDGKTFSAVGLGLALVVDGFRVVLIDLDLNKPDLGRRLGVEPETDLEFVLSNRGTFNDLLVPAPGLPSLLVVPAASGNSDLSEPLTRALPEFLDHARGRADYVILDTPPLGEVSEAVRIARQADDIVVASRLGNTRRANLQAMRDVLERAGRVPNGFVVFGRTGTLSASYSKQPRPAIKGEKRSGLPQPSPY